MLKSQAVIRPFDTEERAAFRETVERFIAADIMPNANEWDEAGDFPWALHEQSGALGLFGLGVPLEYGDAGFDDAFMRIDSATAFGYSGVGGVYASLFSRGIMTGPIANLADEETKKTVLVPVITGKQGGALGMTEPSGGSDLSRLKTTARLDGDEWVLNGEKTFITGGMKAHWFVIGARTGGQGFGGISLFLVSSDSPGFSRTAINRKMGWWASDTANLHFDDCRIPRAAQLGQEGSCLLAIMNNFNYERLGLTG